MDIDEAWNAFQESRSIKKSSISEKLDTISAQLNEIQTDSSRTAELIPKILGDESAIETSNAQMPPMDPSMMGMGGAPPMGDPMGGGLPGAEDMGPDGMDLGADDGMNDDETELPLEEGAPPAGDVPMDEEGGLTETGDGMPEDMPMGDIGASDAQVGGSAGEPLDDLTGEPMPTGAGDTIDVLRELLHQKVDEDDMASVKALADAIEQLGGGIVAGDGLGAPPVEDMPPAPPTDGAFLGKSAAMADAPMVDSDTTVPVQESAAEVDSDIVGKVMEILTEAQNEVADVIAGEDDSPKDEPEGEVEITVESEPEPEEAEEEKAPKADLSDEGEKPFEESCADEVGTHYDMHKSAMDLSFKEVLEARMRGEDPIAEFVQKSAGESNGYNETDLWGLTRRSQMFAKTDGAMSAGDGGAVNPTMGGEVSDATHSEKSATVADEVGCPKETISNKHDGTDPKTIADDVKPPMDHTKGNPKGGDMLDDVDEEKGKSDHSVEGGDMLDDVDEKKGTSDHSVDTADLLDDIDEKKGTSDHSVKGGDMLSELHKVRKSSYDTGIHIKSMREIMAIKKTEMQTGARPDSIVSFGGNLERPELGKLEKSLSPEPVRMGRGVDPHKVVEADWAEYNLYKAQHGL